MRIPTLDGGVLSSPGRRGSRSLKITRDGGLATVLQWVSTVASESSVPLHSSCQWPGSEEVHGSVNYVVCPTTLL
jgi:hypothetical protein